MKKDKETLEVEKANAFISSTAKAILAKTPKEEGISDTQRDLEAHIMAQELYSSELTYED